MPLQDLKLDLSAHDLDLSTYDFALIEGNERIRQQLTIRLLTNRGEWYLNTEHGVPYLDSVWGKWVDRALIEDVFKAEIMKVDDVVEITQFDLDVDPASRKLSIRFSVKTSFGQLDNVTVEI